MASIEIMSTYIKKLSHPLKEIRERSLQLLIAKLRLGWELEDELACTRELLEALFAWFHVQQPSLQEEALQLLLSTIKTKAGTYIAREFGIKKILSTLNKVKSKVEPGAMEIYSDVLDTLRFLNSVESDVRVDIPPLTLYSIADSESDDVSSSGYYILGTNSVSSKESPIINEEPILGKRNLAHSTDGIKVLLFPWIDLCTSDSKTIVLVEDALKLLKSTRRCCRFICDVFLQDFPAEIFLNRPNIIKNLMTIADSGHSGRPGDALYVLLCVTRALRTRLRQLSALDLVHDTRKLLPEQKDTIDNINVELEQITGNDGAGLLKEDNALAALRQLPAPNFALDTLHAVLSIMARSIALVDPDNVHDVLDTKETNICLSLIESLIQLLLDCISPSFWSSEHNSKTLRDLAHKSCSVMRMMGDLMMKYRKLYLENSNKCHNRVVWLRLVVPAEKLLTWTRHSALPPSSIVVALRMAQLDPALELLYPKLYERVSSTLQTSRISVDQEYKTKYRELKKLYASMEDAAQFMKDKNCCRSTKEVFEIIRNSLPALEVHLSEFYLNEISEVILKKTKNFDMNDNDWSIVRSIALTLMAHHIEWVQGNFYRMLAEMVRSVLVGDEVDQAENEKCLTLLCDVGILTEICCHGLMSTYKAVEASASDIMLYLVRGRLVLSEGCWWRLLASLLPVLPLLHVHAAHDTRLGQAICKSLEPDIAECMGVSSAEVTAGLVRLLFVRCPAVQMDAVLQLCRLLDDPKYLPPKDSLRTDVLITALRRVEPQEFNVDYSSSPTKNPSTVGLMQILEVLKQDLVLEGAESHYARDSYAHLSLEPSIRRSTLQQLSVMIRQAELHEMFLQYDGLKIIVTILRMSMLVDDYLAFPECAISCVSVLNSVCFAGRHALAKVPDLPLLLLRVILVFPANDTAVLMSAQILALVAWAGFSLQELDQKRQRVPALPRSVTQRTSLPFVVNSYWNTSPNVVHSSVEWLLSDEDVRSAVSMRRWVACEGVSRVLLGAPPPPAPLALRPATRDLDALRAACPSYSCTKALMELENATSHKQVNEAISLLECYTYLQPLSWVKSAEFAALPWHHTRRFLCAPPASSRDTTLLISLLRFISTYIDNVANEGGAMSWIRCSFIDSDVSVISLLSRDELYLEQTPQENIEVTQLQIHIVKVLVRCIKQLDISEDNKDKMESLVKILLACLDRIDLKNFHMLGYLNELVRCIRYAVNSQHCKLSEDTVVQCMRLMAATVAGCAAGEGRKGQACRLDALLSLLALFRQIHSERIPVQRWSEAWSGPVVQAVVRCGLGASCELRAAALRAMTALAHHAQLLPQLLQAIPSNSLSEFAAEIFSDECEANVVRAAAAALLTALASRCSPHTDILEIDILEQLKRNNFLEHCLDILVEFCNEKSYEHNIEPNVPRSVLERRMQLEVRAQKTGELQISPALSCRNRPPSTALLVAAVADLLHNVSAFASCPVQTWNERGLYRLLFRCATWMKGSTSEIHRVHIACCRALNAAASAKCVRSSLATTKDCLLSLLNTLTPLEQEQIVAESVNARAQTLTLLATLLTERAAGDAVWSALRVQLQATTFFQCLLQCLEGDAVELQDAALYCLTRLTNSATLKKNSDKSKETFRVEYFDGLKSVYISEDVIGDDCQPEYMAEEVCKILVHIYHKLSEDAKIFGNHQDERWHRTCSCLASILAFSPRCRLYGVHRGLPQVLLASLRAIRDRVSLQGSAEVVKSAAQNPILHTLYWVLVLIDCQMLDCNAAKDSFADDGIALSLTRLWPWCMLTEELKEALTHLLFTFSNDCVKAWTAMSQCVGGRNLVNEVCLLCSREASLQSKPRPDTLLLLCLRILRRVVTHHHSRAIILKSDAVTCLYKLRVRERSVSAAGTEWAALCEALARHADGAAALLALRPLLAAPPVRALLMPALAHVARHRRSAVLQAADLLELLSGTLLAGDTAEIVSAARAVWALAANNHKAKLQLRSAGVASAVQSALQRMQRLPKDAAAQRALQILLYTNSILQAT